MNETEHQSTFLEGHQDWRPGSGCDECQRLLRDRRQGAVSPDFSGALFGVVPGGAADTPAVQYQRNFGKGLDEYASARKAGLRPVSTEKGGVERTEKMMESQARALKKLGGDMDTSKLRVHPGVTR